MERYFLARVVPSKAPSIDPTYYIPYGSNSLFSGVCSLWSQSSSAGVEGVVGNLLEGSLASPLRWEEYYLGAFDCTKSSACYHWVCVYVYLFIELYKATQSSPFTCVCLCICVCVRLCVCMCVFVIDSYDRQK